MSREPLDPEIVELRRRVAELEAALEAQAERASLYQAIFEDLPIPSIVYRTDGNLVDINVKQRTMSAVPSRESVIDKYNICKDPESIRRGYTASFERSLGLPLGEAVTMPPTEYDSAGANFERTESRKIYTQSAFRPTDVNGERYIISTHVDVTDRVRAEHALEENSAFFRGILENAPVIIDVKDREGRYILANAPREAMAGVPRGGMLGKTDRDIFPEDIAAEYILADQEVLERETPIARELECAEGCNGRSYMWTKYPLRDTAGRVAFVCSIAIDITARKRAEAEAIALQNEMLAVKDATLRALSTPLLPIAKGVVVLPLIGTVDAKRANAVLETLLEGITAHQAERVIIDVTGVPTVDAEVAHALVQTARAVKLLGAEVVLTGLQPALARTLVDLGADLGDIRTLATLESGIALSLRAPRKHPK